MSERLSAQLGYEVPLLAQVPLDIALREGGDRGQPVVDAQGPSADALRAIGHRLAGAERGLAGRPLGVSPVHR